MREQIKELLAQCFIGDDLNPLELYDKLKELPDCPEVENVIYRIGIILKLRRKMGHIRNHIEELSREDIIEILDWELCLDCGELHDGEHSD